MPGTVDAGTIDALTRFLRMGSGELYALLDAARDQSIPDRLAISTEEHVSLYDGEKGKELERFGPWLVRLPPESRLLSEILTDGWGDNWGVFLNSTATLDELRRHFRRFLMVKLPDGEEAYFRFYDPRVLWTYLPTCKPEELVTFFGPVTRFALEHAGSADAFEFKPADRVWRGAGIKVSPSDSEQP